MSQTSETTYIRDSRPNPIASTFPSLDITQNNLAYRASEKSRLGKVEEEALYLFTYDFKNVTPGFPRVRIRLGRRRGFC